MRRDFRLFLYLVWKSGYIPGDPDPTPIQYDIARYLQHGPKRCVIEAFRGVGKSWITSAFVCWLLYCNPQLNILVVSASKQRADSFSTFTLRLITEMPLLAHLIPRDGQRCSKIEFDVAPAKASHSASVRSAGITGQITGSRADVIIGDDVEVPHNSATEALRDKLAEAVKEFDSIIKPLFTARIIFLGTPQTEQSIYNLLPERGYDIRIWPARYPDNATRMRHGERLAPLLIERLERHPTLSGKPTDPKRFDDADLDNRALSLGRSTFALQFMLDATLSDADRYPLKLSDLVVMDLDHSKGPADLAWSNGPEQTHKDLPNVGFNGDRFYRPIFVSSDWVKYDEIIMTIDPSGRGGDETGYAVLASLFGRLYLLDVGAVAGGYSPETLQAISMVAKRFGVHGVVVEPNFGDGMFNQLLRPVLSKIHACNLEEAEWSRTQKEQRIIDTLEPVMNQHRLVVDRKLIERDFKSTEERPTDEQNRFRFFYQLTHITRDRGSLHKDDRLDAVALAVRYYLDKMDRDAQESANRHREELLLQELRGFEEAVFQGGVMIDWGQGGGVVTIF